MVPEKAEETYSAAPTPGSRSVQPEGAIAEETYSASGSSRSVQPADAIANFTQVISTSKLSTT